MLIRDYNRITGGTMPNTVEELVNQMKVAYDDSFNVKVALDELRNLERKGGESIEEFGGRVHEILDNGIEIAQEKSNPEQVNGVKSVLDEEAVSGFLGGLHDDAMMMSIINQKVEGLTDAIRLATSYARQKKIVSNSVSHRLTANKSTVFAINPNDNIRCFNCNQLGHFQSDCQLINNNKYAPSNRNFKICNFCKKSGHLEAQCYKRNFQSPRNSFPHPAFEDRRYLNYGRERRDSKDEQRDSNYERNRRDFNSEQNRCDSNSSKLQQNLNSNGNRQ